MTARTRSTDPALPGISRSLAPEPALLDLPEKAVQFGTGAFLRGFVEYFIDEANRKGLFGGRIVAIGSTGSGRDSVLNDQDGLYTLSIQGLDHGVARQEHRIISSLAGALSANIEWDAVLELARSPRLELVFSNTTEVGIALDDEEDLKGVPPRSFPGKLTRFLYERAATFDFDRARGLVVVPCELIERNGDRLKEIVLELAERGGLGPAFRAWVDEAVVFCNTLVDRIVPGVPDAGRRAEIERSLGYRDALLTTCEVYRLFAIQVPGAPVGALAPEGARDRLRWTGADPGIILTDDVTPYRERKVRLLNGTHTIMVPAALLSGCETVLDAVGHELVGRFIRRAMFEEIVPSLDAKGYDPEAFARETLDRFSNPYVRHALIDITMYGTMKMKVRVVPSILAYAAKFGRAPASLAFGFAAFLLFMRGETQAKRRAAGLEVPKDDHADHFRALWHDRTAAGDAGIERMVRTVCADQSLWGADLTAVPGFAEAVAEHLVLARRAGVPAALEAHLSAVAGH